jgi:hypothetical protein
MEEINSSTPLLLYTFTRLPGRLTNARNFSVQRHLAETDTAQTELAQERARTATACAAADLAGRELRLSVRLFD